VHALTAAGEAARGGTLYCNLEPCSFHGRTPPCADAVIAAGVRRVVCSLQDPDPRVSGRGFERLRAAGIEVGVGVRAPQAEEQNAAYLHHRRTGRPLVILKLGQTLDGRIATAAGASRWITGETARRHAHRWRSWVDVVAVGAGTVLADDPALTVRHVRGRDPRPLVIDGRLRCDPRAQVFGGREPILATAASTAPAERQVYADRGAEVWALEDTDGRIDLGQLWTRAGDAGLTSVILEGGRTLVAAALRDRAVDRVMLYIAPRVLGGDAMASVGALELQSLDETPRLEGVRTRRLGDDLLVSGKVVYPCSPG
jgi:diaminohydroxyphosphoribosylaminopyrimidine deaminase/5-amino-6-(5-phosphoribosylamino)uracil reductase